LPYKEKNIEIGNILFERKNTFELDIEESFFSSEKIIKNNITINWDAVQLTWFLIDYLIVLELVHTIIKNHSKESWADGSKYIPDWKERDIRMSDLNL